MDFTLPPLLTAMVDRGNGLLWGSVLIYLLIGAGLYFTVMTRAIQIRYFGHMFKLLRGSRHSNGGISSFQALSTSLAARVGTGNLAGVAVAIYFGGPGHFLDVDDRHGGHGDQLCGVHAGSGLQNRPWR